MRKMAVTTCRGGLALDTDVEPGYVVAVDRARLLAAHPTTASRLWNGGWGDLMEMLRHQPDGLYSIPESVMDPAGDDVDYGEVAEVKMALSLLEPAVEPSCQHPPCILSATHAWGGYSLCSYHGEMLAS